MTTPFLGRAALVQSSAASGGAAIQEFPAAPLDRATKLITGAVLAAMVGLILSIPAQEAAVPGAVLGCAGALAFVLLSYGYAPAAYELTDSGELRIRRRLFGGRRFRVDAAQAVSAVFGLGGIRLTGSGGFFGWYGLFWRKGTGRYRAYVTDRSKLVACTGPKGLVVLSPADPAAFLSAVSAR